MRIPRFWEKVSIEQSNIACWGWSNSSPADARQLGRERAEKALAKHRAGNELEQYPYGVCPLREKVLDEWKREDGSLQSAVTVNSYGCWVLNSADVMFVDVDLPNEDGSQKSNGLMGRLFGKKTEEADPRTEFEDQALSKVQALVNRVPQVGARIYRTKAGLRYLMTHTLVNPTADTTLQTMEELGADPLYVRLCKAQECFRARLTPKPWRCDSPALPYRYPWSSESEEREAQSWLSAYQAKAREFSTCQFLQHLGATEIHPAISRTLSFHDEMTKAVSGLALA